MFFWITVSTQNILSYSSLRNPLRLWRKFFRTFLCSLWMSAPLVYEVLYFIVNQIFLFRKIVSFVSYYTNLLIKRQKVGIIGIVAAPGKRISPALFLWWTFTFFVDGIRRLSVFTQNPHSSVSCLTNSKYLPYRLVPRPFSLNFLSKSQGQHGRTKKRQENDDLKDQGSHEQSHIFKMVDLQVRHKKWKIKWLKCHPVKYSRI